jgi:outer membrane protein assembly factor BamD
MVLRVLKSFRNSLLFVGLALLLPACSGGGVLDDVFNKDSNYQKGKALSPDMSKPDDQQVAGLYNDGLSRLNNGSYSAAAKKFAEVERLHPYSKWATKALLMQSFAFYQDNLYSDSINASQRFISLHPGHVDTPYAYYLVGLSQYEQIADVQRDQSQTQSALEALDEVSRRFPDSRYAADARQVGRYYVKHGSYLAGINRFKTVVTKYQTSSQTPEALYRLSESYMALGIVSEAQTAAAVLGHNFPRSQWYKDAYTLVSSDGRAPVANQDSWLSKLFSL